MMALEPHTIIGAIAVNIAWVLISIVSMVCITTPIILIYRLLSHKTFSRRRRGTETIIFLVLLAVIVAKIIYFKTLQISMLYDLVVAYFLTRFWEKLRTAQTKG